MEGEEKKDATYTGKIGRGVHRLRRPNGTREILYVLETLQKRVRKRRASR